jgi:hypothetical protein
VENACRVLYVDATLSLGAIKIEVIDGTIDHSAQSFALLV